MSAPPPSPDQTRPCKARPDQTRPDQTRPCQTEFIRTEQNKMDQNRTDQNRTEQNRSELNRSEQNGSELNRIYKKRTTETELNLIRFRLLLSLTYKIWFNWVWANFFICFDCKQNRMLSMSFVKL